MYTALTLILVKRLLSTGAILLALALAAPAHAADSTTPAPTLERFEFTEPEMGVPFRIVLYAPDSAKAQAGAKAAFQRVAQLNEIMSDYETDSELNELSRTAGQGKAVPVSNDLWIVLQKSQELAERSEGTFDITVGPAISLWRKARRSQHLPDPDRLAEARKAIGYQKLRLNPANHSAELLVPGMKLDLGGIAKGYALDQALAVLRARGMSRALVSGGGDMAIGEAPPGQQGWRVEIAPLDVPNAPPRRFVLLAQRALATSGDVFQRLELDGQRYSHIVDPRTGVGLQDHSLVTVIARDCISADSLATAASVLGPEKGLRLIEQTPGAAVYIVRKPYEQIEVLQSPGFREFLQPD